MFWTGGERKGIRFLLSYSLETTSGLCGLKATIRQERPYEQVNRIYCCLFFRFVN